MIFLLCPLLSKLLTLPRKPTFCFLVIRLPKESKKGRETPPPSQEVTVTKFFRKGTPSGSIDFNSI